MRWKTVRTYGKILATPLTYWDQSHLQVLKIYLKHLEPPYMMMMIIIIIINDNFYSTLSKSSKALHNQGEKSKVIFERNHSLK